MATLEVHMMLLIPQNTLSETKSRIYTPNPVDKHPLHFHMQVPTGTLPHSVTVQCPSEGIFYTVI